MKKIFFFTTFMLILFKLFSQDADKIKVYSYEGKIDKYPISMLLIVDDNSKISGFYVYQKHAQLIKLDGEVDKNFDLFIDEIDEKNNYTSKFIGKTDKSFKTINGNWQTNDKKKTLAFSLNQTKSVKDTFKIKTKKGDIVLNIKILNKKYFSIPFIMYRFDLHYCQNNRCDDRPSVVSLNDAIVPRWSENEYLNQIYYDFDYKKMLEKIQNKYSEFLEYTSDFDSINNAENLYMYQYEYNWGLTADTIINNFLFYSEADYYYTGGAHPNHSMSYIIYDLKNGEKLTLDKIFIKTKIEKIDQLLRDYIKNDEGLMEAIFEIEKVTTVNNFSFDQAEIRFFFNPYEIAPYAAGEIEIPISWIKLKEYIQPWFKDRMSIK